MAPHIPKELEGQPVALDFQNPNGRGTWAIEHKYDSQADSYALGLSGDFAETPVLEITTPPLSAGHRPRLKAKDGGSAPAYTVKQQQTKEGKTRYTLRFEGLQGQQDIGLDMGAL